MALITRQFKKQTYLIPDSLIHNAGVINAIVGFNTYTATLSGLTANTLYFLYLRNGTGTALYYSTTVPSSYRSSYPEAILVGAFYSNGITGSIAFGSFVNIEGIPYTDDIAFTSTIPFGSFTQDRVFWQRMGNKGNFQFGGHFTGTPSAGVSITFTIPFTILSGKVGTDNGEAPWGEANITNESSKNYGVANLRKVGASTFGIYLAIVNDADAYENASMATTTTNAFTMSTNDLIGAKTTLIPISGWNNTPLKDL